MTGHEAPRWLSTVGPPLPASTLVSFPVRSWRPSHECWRTHDHRGPWYFASSPGRFNLSGNRGTLNTASDERTAVRESLGNVLCGQSEIHASYVDGRTVSKLSIPPRELADFTADDAAAAGVVAGDFSGPTDTGYAAFRLWATAFDDAGFEGIFNRSRFGTGLAPACIYFFGPAGVQAVGTIIHSVPVEDVLHQIGTYQVVQSKDSGSLSFEN